MAKYKSGIVILDYEGNPAKERGANGELVDMTLRSVVTTALNVPVQGNSMTVEQMGMAFRASLEANTRDEVELSVSDRKFILDRIALGIFGPLVYGRINELFEGE